MNTSATPTTPTPIAGPRRPFLERLERSAVKHRWVTICALPLILSFAGWAIGEHPKFQIRAEFKAYAAAVIAAISFSVCILFQLYFEIESLRRVVTDDSIEKERTIAILAASTKTRKQPAGSNL
jgi:hypothetical protein